MPTRPFEPCIPTRGTKVPVYPDWIHEIKHDGYRLIVLKDHKRVRLFTRNGHDWTDRYPLIVEARSRTAPAPSSSMARRCYSASTAISMDCIPANMMRGFTFTPSIASRSEAKTCASCH
jgi:hypothetical protein